MHTWGDYVMGEALQWGALKVQSSPSERRAYNVTSMAAWRQAISKNLKEVRIHLCQTSKSSQGVR